MDNNQLDPPTQYDSEKYWDQRYDNIKKYSDTYDWYLKPSKSKPLV